MTGDLSTVSGSDSWNVARNKSGNGVNQWGEPTRFR